ncbi:MAG: hypothetical protein K1X95_00500 [Acidimicrobiia bacterium]|nr:hypothetical protein [Acidimicrobiia bacterium]
MAKPALSLIACALLAFAATGACAGATRGHLPATSAAQTESTLLYADGSGTTGGGEPWEATTSTAVAPTSAPAPGAGVPGAGISAPCASQVRLPDHVDGYTVTPGDSAALGLFALPPGLQGTGLNHVTRGDGAVVDLVSVSGAAYVFGAAPDATVLDRFARSVGISGQPAAVAVGAHHGVVVQTSTGSTMYAWMPCRGAVMAAAGRDAAMTADVVARVSR